MNCCICGKEMKSFGSLSKHIRDVHTDIPSIKNYYDKFLIKNVNDGKCIICGASTKWRNIRDGYNITCGHKCGCVYHRNNLRNDKCKMLGFVEKVKHNQTNIWKNREINGDKEKIFNKVSAKNRLNNSKMCEEERKKRFGWLNKLSIEDKEKQVKLILEKSLIKFYREANPVEIQKVLEKRIETRIKNGTMSDPIVGKEFINYQRRVRSKSDMNYRKYKESLDPNNLRGREFHLDHKISILYGFINNIPEEFISHINNLEIIPSKINLQKNTKCSINADDLVLSIKESHE